MFVHVCHITIIVCFVIGINSACSTYSYIWCKCSAEQRKDDPEKEWSLMDVTKGARTTEENCSLGSQSKKKYGVSHPPLFQNISLKNVVIDNLHLFFRVLFNLIVLELKRQNAIAKVTKFNKFDIIKNEGQFKNLRFSFLPGTDIKGTKVPILDQT